MFLSGKKKLLHLTDLGTKSFEWNQGQQYLRQNPEWFDQLSPIDKAKVMLVGVSAHKNEATATFAVRDVALHISPKSRTWKMAHFLSRREIWVYYKHKREWPFCDILSDKMLARAYYGIVTWLHSKKYINNHAEIIKVQITILDDIL